MHGIYWPSAQRETIYLFYLAVITSISIFLGLNLEVTQLFLDLMYKNSFFYYNSLIYQKFTSVA